MRDKAKSASKGSVKEQEWVIRQGDGEQQDEQESMGSMSAARAKLELSFVGYSKCSCSLLVSYGVRYVILFKTTTCLTLESSSVPDSL